MGLAPHLLHIISASRTPLTALTWWCCSLRNHHHSHHQLSSLHAGQHASPALELEGDLDMVAVYDSHLSKQLRPTMMGLCWTPAKAPTCWRAGSCKWDWGGPASHDPGTRQVGQGAIGNTQSQGCRMVYCPRAPREGVTSCCCSHLGDAGDSPDRQGGTPAGRTVSGYSMDTAEGLGRMLRSLQLLPASLFHDPGC